MSSIIFKITEMNSDSVATNIHRDGVGRMLDLRKKLNSGTPNAIKFTLSGRKDWNIKIIKASDKNVEYMDFEIAEMNNDTPNAVKLTLIKNYW